MKIKGLIYAVLVASTIILTSCPQSGASEEYGVWVVTSDTTTYWLYMYDLQNDLIKGRVASGCVSDGTIDGTPDNLHLKRTSKNECFSVKVKRISGNDSIWVCPDGGYWGIKKDMEYFCSPAFKNRKDVSVLLPEEHAKKIYFNRQCEIVREETEK